MQNKFRGTGVALVTPFHSDYTVDFDGLKRLLSHVSDGGVDFLVVFGTTAESATLSETEKTTILAFIQQNNVKNLPIVLGIGGNNTAAVLDIIKKTDFTGIDAILSVTPYYNKPSQEGLYQHFKAIAETSPIPIILYNVPSRTGVNMIAATTIRLAQDFPNIIGIKEASGVVAQTVYVLRDRPKEFLVLSGEDNLALACVALGGDGVISVAANSFPTEFCKMIRCGLDGDLSKAASIQLKLQEPIDALFKEGNPSGVKGALEILGVCASQVRLPLVAATPELMRYLDKLIKASI